MMQSPNDDLFSEGSKPQVGGGKGAGDKYGLVEQVRYLYVRVVKARDLPAIDVTGSCEVRLGNYKGITRHFERESNPEWNQVFGFSKDRIQASVLEVTVKDKDMVKDDFMGWVLFDVNEIPIRIPPDSPLAPEWYRLEDRKGNKAKGELMLAVWWGTQADEAFPEAWHSDAAAVGGSGADALANIRSKVYLSPNLWYLRVNVIEAQDLALPSSTKSPELLVKATLGQQTLKTKISTKRSHANPVWNEELMFVAEEPFEEPLIFSVEDRSARYKNKVVGICAIHLLSVERRLDHSKAIKTRWFNLENDDGELASRRLHMAICLEGGYHVLDESTHYLSDLRPTANRLWKKSIGILELGILGATGLSHMKMKLDGMATTDAFCVAKYGKKWIRTRTILDSLAPKWNEQYTWEVFDPCTVVAIGVFDNCHLEGGSARDSSIGQVRIRLSALENTCIPASCSSSIWGEKDG